LALASLTLILVVGEGIAHLAWEDPRPYTPPSPPPAWKDLPKIEGLFELAKPNLRGLTAGVLFETNSWGFRGPERSRDKPPGVFRIVVIGDSVTMGWGALYEHTYAARLERELNGAGSTQRYEVLNIGLSGLNTHWAVSRFEKLGLRFDPDMVIYGHTLNDIEGPSYRKTRDDSFLHSLQFRHSSIYLVRVLGPRWLSLRELIHPPEGSYIHELDDNYFRNPDAWNYVLAALDRLAAISRQRDICAVVLIHTRLNFLRFFHPFHRLYRAVSAAAEERGLFVIPSAHLFLGRSPPELWVNPFDPHPNAEGHQLLAEALSSGLEELPATCWKRTRRSAAPEAAPR
jgi:lysophospholipase L1-like esterase